MKRRKSKVFSKDPLPASPEQQDRVDILLSLSSLEEEPFEIQSKSVLKLPQNLSKRTKRILSAVVAAKDEVDLPVSEPQDDTFLATIYLCCKDD